MQKNSLEAGFTIGFLGAGQLARMSALQAFRFGMQVAVFSDRSEQEPVEFVTPHAYNGSFDDVESMIEFARACDVITLENEFIDSSILFELRERTGTPIYPSPESFEMIENKEIEKLTFSDAGIPVTPSRIVQAPEEIEAFADEFGWPVMLKSSKGGYDGYGNRTVKHPGETSAAFSELGGDDGRDILAESFVDFTHELAVQVARNGSETVVYPCVETVQQDHICVAVKSPADIDPVLAEEAQRLARKAAEAIDGRGIFAFEFFLTTDGQVLLNETAPRPHNSGHYTIEGCITSQFENHIRAVTGLPLGSSELTHDASVMINLLGTDKRTARVDFADDALNQANGHLHIYGKTGSKPGRKMAHYTLLGDSMEEIYDRAIKATLNIRI
ncbi:5-(carboxyamino)imidazole ribonucleotide synthase [Rhodohalobacter sp. SW132]|uniref:5-(carboxyamino)imidazole ribonucleotide synthase n=1 Tax=Rhodohalobacter sp. SW132 TaxID=2293433 RepID=UPI000E23FD0F|nr:5-(carboxyamino)imidazole ribonucleotide synthase [Rhodohalobacter sp. SW132]REL37661.1 5-(carboxyamino)imidazole ribonucleotide synthase [Rhodohalobacter sp. SW132]